MAFKSRGSVGGSIERKLKMNVRFNENRIYFINSNATHRKRRSCKRSKAFVYNWQKRTVGEIKWQVEKG